MLTLNLKDLCKMTTQSYDERDAMLKTEVKPSQNGSKHHGQDVLNNISEMEVKINKSNPNVYVMDSAYGWVICFAAFIIYLLAAAFNRALTISFLDFVEIFDVSITTTSLSFTFLLVAISISALLVMNVMVPLTGERTAVVAGCVGNALCTIGVGLSPNITVFLLCMGFKGLCTGTAFVPTIGMISQYFDKRRSIATSLAYCGLGVGSMAAPPVVEYLKETYGLLGMFLIVGALEMNAVAAAMLLRPISNYKYVISNVDDKDDTDSKENVTSDMEMQELINLPNDSNSENKKALTNGIYDVPGEVKTYSVGKSCQNESVLTNDYNDTRDRSNSMTLSLKNSLIKEEQNHDNGDLKTAQKPTKPKQRSQSFRDDSAPAYQDTTEPLVFKDNGLRPILMKQLSVDSKAEGQQRYMSDGKPQGNSVTVIEEADEFYIQPKIQSSTPNVNRRGLKPSSTLYVRGLSIPGSTFIHGPHLPDSRRMSSSWSIASAPMCEMPLDVEVLAMETSERRSQISGLNRFGSHVIPQGNNTARSKNIAPEAENKLDPWWAQTKKVFQDMFSKELLKTWALPILLLASAAGALVQYLLSYLPTLASKQGLGTTQISTLLTVSGAIELVSRILIGLFSDLKILSPGQIVAISQVVMGTTMHFVYLFTDFNSLMILSIIVGVFGNTRQNLNTLITIEFMGISRFRRALGFQAMFSTLSLAIHHPLLSSVLEATGSFSAPLHYVGVFMYIAACLVLMAPLTKRWDERAEARKKQRQQDEKV